MVRLIENERARAGIRRRLTVLLHGHRGLAATIGTLRPAIVLGHDVAEMPESQLRSVVIHEVAHIRRGDFLANVLGSVAMLLYWPSPLFCLPLQSLEHKMVAYGELRIRCSREIQRWAIESSRL